MNKKNTTDLSSPDNTDVAWKILVNNCEEGMAIINDKAKILYFNKAMVKLTGYTAEEAKTISNWVQQCLPTAAARKTTIKNFREDLKKSRIPRREYFIKTKGGEERWLTFKMLRLKNGLITINSEDITDQRNSHLDLLKTRFTVDHASDNVFILNNEAQFVYANDSACKALGYTTKQLLALTVHDIDPNFPKSKWNVHWKQLKKKKAITIESCHKKKNGKIFPVEISINYQVFDGIEYNYAFARDISVRKETHDEMLVINQQLKASEQQLKASNEQLMASEQQLQATNQQLQASEQQLVSSNEELRQSEKRFRQLSEASFEGILIHDNGILLQANKQFFAMNGYDPADLLGQRVLEKVIAPEVLDDVLKRVNMQDTSSYETIGLRKDGTRFPAEVRIRMMDHQGRKVRVGAIRDITEQKSSQAKLAMLAAAVHEAAESIMITDTEGNILYANPCFETMSGYKLSEVSGKNANILKSGRQDGEFYKEMWDTITQGTTWSGQFTNRKKDGSLFEEEAVISPVRDPSGTIVSYVAVKRDVSHEMLLEDQVRQSQKMAAIGQLAHKVAHDFTNVLVMILGNAQLAKDNAKSPELSQYLDPIMAAGNRIATLTADLMAFAHPTPLKLKTVRLSRAVASVEEMLLRTIGPEIEVILDLDQDRGKVNIDPAQIAQVIIHMGINAAEAMNDRGTLTISTRPANLSVKEIQRLRAGIHPLNRHDTDYTVLTISDTGCGMTRDVILRIYEPFFTTKMGTHNSGLGLTTSYAIIEQHNGIMTTDSQPGEGTTFRIYLPTVQEETPSDEA